MQTLGILVWSKTYLSVLLPVGQVTFLDTTGTEWLWMEMGVRTAISMPVKQSR